jgi:hypothetical protein
MRRKNGAHRIELYDGKATSHGGTTRRVLPHQVAGHRSGIDHDSARFYLVFLRPLHMLGRKPRQRLPPPPASGRTTRSSRGNGTPRAEGVVRRTARHLQSSRRSPRTDSKRALERDASPAGLQAADACDQNGMSMGFTGVRLFHHSRDVLGRFWRYRGI